VVHRVRNGQDRTLIDRRDDGRVPDAVRAGEQARRDHGRAGRESLVRGDRKQPDRNEHARRRGHRVDADAEQRAGGDRRGTGRRDLVYGTLRPPDRRLASDGTISEYLLPIAANQPIGITVGLDCNLWFTEAPGNRIGKITPSGAINDLPVLPHAQSQPWEITTGPDGNLWFTERLGNRIGRLNVDGTLTEFDLPTPKALPNTIRPGPDANAARDCRVERRAIGEAAFRLVYGGAAAFGTCVAVHATTASLWFSEEGGRIDEITTGGAITEHAVPTAAGTPLGVTDGPDGNVWFTEFDGNKFGSLGVDDVGPR